MKPSNDTSNYERNNERRNLIRSRSLPLEPTSLFRDKPLAELRRHQHTPLVTMNIERTQQLTPIRTTAEATTNSQNPPYKSNESTTSQPNQTMPFSRNLDGRSPPPSPPLVSHPFLPSIDEASSEVHHRQKNSASHVPALSAASDNSSIDSYLHCESMHSIDMDSSDSSDISVDYEYENDDDIDISASYRSTQSDIDISASYRSTQSVPANFASLSRKGISARRRPDSSKRSYPCFPAKQQQQSPPHHYIRPSRASYASDSALPSVPFSSPLQHKIPPSSVRRMSRRQSYPPATEYDSDSYTKTTKFPCTDPVKIMNRKQCMVNFLHFLFSGVCLQLILLSAIAVLVIWSRSQAALATDTLLRLRESESMGLLKLHRLESHSMHVHELIRNRLLRQNGKYEDMDDLEDLLDGEDPEEIIDPEDDPLLDQYQQLTKMSSDLRNHAAVTTLQSTIQQMAIEEMTDIYGEGPVKVVIELDFGDKPLDAQNNNNSRQAKHTHDMIKGTFLSIVLWPDTPHAAWAWLEQIGRSVWDGSSIEWDPTSTHLQFQPTKDDPKDRGHLEFIEGHPSQEKSNPDMHHGAWTIGLRETLGEDQEKGRLEMFINLANNEEERKHETCVGKIFDGFDALQRLLEGTEVTDGGDAITQVTVRSVSAMHMTHKEFGQIYR